MPSAHKSMMTVSTRPMEHAKVLGYAWLRRKKMCWEETSVSILTRKNPSEIKRISKSHTATLFWISTTPSGERSVVKTHSLHTTPVPIRNQPIHLRVSSTTPRDQVCLRG